MVWSFASVSRTQSGTCARRLRIVAAAAALLVEQFAGDAGVVDRARVLVLELDQTAASAAVAELFPLRRG